MPALDSTLDRLPESLTADEALALLARIAQGEASTPSRTLSSAAAPTGHPPELKAELAALIADTLHLSPDEVAHDRPLMELGLDSISATDLMGRFNETHGLSVPSTILFEFDTIDALATHLTEIHGDALARSSVSPLAPEPPLAPAPPPSRALEGTRPSPPPPPDAARPRAHDEVHPEPSAPEAAKPPSTAPRRVDVKTLWAEIEAGLKAAPPAAWSGKQAISHRPDESAWARCAEMLKARITDAYCLQLPDRSAAIGMLQATGAGRCLWVGPEMPEGATAFDPLGETALEDLIASAGHGLVVCFASCEALAGLPPHLLRALESLRAEARCQLALFVLPDALPDSQRCETTRPDLLFAGRAPLVAAAVAPAYTRRCDQTALQRMAVSYRNNWETAALASAFAGAGT